MAESVPAQRTSAASVHLDFVRGISALAVLIFHVRYRFFVDYSELNSPGLMAKAFYTVTSFGHDAVMAFFVLSGFFIATSVRRSSQLQRWSWKKYVVNRGARLYVVLIPALALTFFWDSIGIAIQGEHAVYTGTAQQWKHDYFDVSSRLSGTTLLGNLVYLQTVLVPPYGSNEPLWSLAYEFWYYALFPCVFLLLFHYKSPTARAMCLIAAAAIAWLVGRQILLYFPIWLMGAVVGCIPLCSGLQGRGKIPATVLAALFAVSMAVAGHLAGVKDALGGSGVTMDYLTGVGCAVLVYAILHHQNPAAENAYATLARWLADFSFTLYVAHIPFLVLLRSMINSQRPWEATANAIAAAAGITVVAIAYALLVYWLTERHTASVRSWLFARVISFSPPARNDSPAVDGQPSGERG